MNDQFNDNTLIFNILLVGVIRLLHLGKISNDQARWIIFSPGGLDRVEKNKNISDFSDIINRSLELEDILSLLGVEKYQQELVKIEKELTERVVPGEYEDMYDVSKIITSLGLNFD